MAGGERPLRVVSWNVNGLRAAAKKGFLDWLEAVDADIVGVQETRATPEQLSAEVREPEGWHTHFVAAERLGYSGVGLFAREAPHRVDVGLGRPEFDVEGRIQVARWGRLVVINGYFPNGNGKERDNSRVPYKLEFTREVLELAQRKRRGGMRVLVMGDVNTAHREIDLARPKDNVKTSGFLPEERAALDEWLEAGWLDTFREFEEGPGHYSWWTARGDCRARNIGWRLDYVFASPNVRPFLQRAFISPEVLGSDHCPVGVDLARGVID